MAIKAAEKQNATHKIAATLRAEILSGAISIGDRIAGEHELMARYSVSRQTVREALRELSSQGLVESRRGPAGGAFVAAPDLARLGQMMTSAGAHISAGSQFAHRDVCIAIFEIEAACARLAARRRDSSALEAMRRALDNAVNAPNESCAFFDAFMSFNRALWDASGNPPLAFVMQAFMQALRSSIGARRDDRDFSEYRAFLSHNHAVIFAALEAGDEVGAVRALQDNMAFWLAHPETVAK
ncbi:GntR family transcriptional regulator [Sphingobium sp. MK2]|uniref:FadR/GntR family transcriptional regulator n=1 Tax=Sphingobium sp. MK2 TaxID=3116540 RepID=UPI0032E36507